MQTHSNTAYCTGTKAVHKAIWDSKQSSLVYHQSLTHHSNKHVYLHFKITNTDKTLQRLAIATWNDTSVDNKQTNLLSLRPSVIFNTFFQSEAFVGLFAFCIDTQFWRCYTTNLEVKTKFCIERLFHGNFKIIFPSALHFASCYVSF